MFRRIALGVGGILSVVVLVAVGFLIPAHLGVRRVRPPLPAVDTVRAAVAATNDVPVRLSWINTASQKVPRSGVLGAGDPHPDRPYRLCHSVFVLEWADGRTLLVDAGMTRAQAASFGGMGELIGAEPIEVLSTVSEGLGARSANVAGIVFSHLHVDHVDGVRELCEQPRPSKVAVFMTPEQSDHVNYTTGGGLDTVDALECLRRVELSGGGMVPVPGFPGVFVIAAGGHTPGSQIVVVAVRTKNGRRLFAFTGDIVNHIDGIEYDIGKPFAYSLLVVPESTERLGELRRFLRSLRDGGGFELLVSHDQDALERSSVPRFDVGAR